MKIQPTYTTFEQSKLFKEKGFDELVLTYWSKRDGLIDNGITLDNFNNRGEWATSRPEQWQVIEWLRINHGIWVEVRYLDEILNFGYLITTMKDNTEQQKKYGYNTPQEAYSAAFDYIKDNNLI